jgi:LysM repeat protein
LAGIQDLFLSENATGGTKPKAPRSVVVEEGDTLSSLAIDNLGSNDHQAVQRLMKANPLLIDPNLIYPGQTVFLPTDSH